MLIEIRNIIINMDNVTNIEIKEDKINNYIALRIKFNTNNRYGDLNMIDFEFDSSSEASKVYKNIKKKMKVIEIED